MRKASELNFTSLGKWFVWTVLWTASMTASAAYSLYALRYGVLDGMAYRLIGVFALGAMFAFPAASLVLTFVPARWAAGQRFGAAFLVFGAATTGFTALLVALDFLGYYSQWHDDHVSKRLFFETVTTILSACYQFLVLGMRHFLPIGFVALVAASGAFALRRL